MQRKGVRISDLRPNRSAAAEVAALAAAMLPAALVIVLLMFAALVGCSSLRQPNEAVIKVETKRNTAKAQRLTQTGIVALEKEHVAVAEKRFREAIAADYRYGPAHNNLGLMYYEQGDLYQAVLAFEEARGLMPDDPAVVYNLGLALEAAGRTADALDLYYTANAMDPTNPNFLGNLVRLRVRQGDYDELLQAQLRDLVLIETRPDWRRWADTQLALTVNDMLDRGPATPDLDAVMRTGNDAAPTDLNDKIIDLTPEVATAYQEQNLPAPGSDPLRLEPPWEESAEEPREDNNAPTDSVPAQPALQESDVEDLTGGR